MGANKDSKKWTVQIEVKIWAQNEIKYTGKNLNKKENWFELNNGCKLKKWCKLKIEIYDTKI